MVALGVISAAGLTWALHRNRGFTFDTISGLTVLAVSLGLVGARAWFVATHPALFAPWFRAFPAAGNDFGTGAAVAAAVAVLLALYARPALRPLGPAAIVVVACASAIAFMIGARAGSLRGRTPADPFDPQGGGLAFFGGFALAAPACLALAARRGIAPLAAADSVAPGLLAACALGRTGCLLNGCCSGRPWESPLALGGHIPTQVLESTVTAGAAALLAARGGEPGSGRIAAVAALVYAAARFTLDFLRDDVSPALAFLTPSQLAALLLAAAGGALLLRPAPAPRPS
jgi:prolipoprotein diacylglyceryltransferase